MKKQQAFNNMNELRGWGEENAAGSFSANLLTSSERWPLQPVTIDYAPVARLMDQDEVWQSAMGGAL